MRMSILTGACTTLSVSGHKISSSVRIISCPRDTTDHHSTVNFPRINHTTETFYVLFLTMFPEASALNCDILERVHSLTIKIRKIFVTFHTRNYSDQAGVNYWHSVANHRFHCNENVYFIVGIKTISSHHRKQQMCFIAGIQPSINHKCKAVIKQKKQNLFTLRRVLKSWFFHHFLAHISRQVRSKNSLVIV